MLRRQNYTNVHLDDITKESPVQKVYDSDISCLRGNTFYLLFEANKKVFCNELYYPEYLRNLFNEAYIANCFLIINIHQRKI